jgi:hypothetical protein
VIEIFIDQGIVPTGGLLTGNVRWKGDRRPNRFIVAAQWETEGVGNAEWGVGRAAIVEPHGDALEVTFPVRLMIPHEGPISFEGTLMAIAWKLAVRVDQPGLDEFAECPFRVAPRKHQSVAPTLRS